MTLGDIIANYRLEHGMTMERFAEISGLSKGYISMLERNSHPKTGNPIAPTLNTFLAVANAIGMELDALLETVDSDQRLTLVSSGEKKMQSGGDNFTFLPTVEYVKIPIVGSIPAGVPIEAIEDVLGEAEIPSEWLKGDKKYIALQVDGSSMYPLLLDGDIVILRIQETAESGDICACYVNGYDATLKRIKLTESSITLIPENPNYAPVTYTHPGEVTIAGKVVQVRRNI